MKGLNKLDEKICTIVNGRFSYLLVVDGQTISFNGMANAEYFEKHYEELGYKVLKVDESRTETKESCRWD